MTNSPTESLVARLTESEWLARQDLRKNWAAFCDADAFEGSEDFADRMEAAGLVELKWLDEGEAQATIDADPFWAAKFGDQMPSSVYVLTDDGRTALSNEAGK